MTALSNPVRRMGNRWRFSLAAIAVIFATVFAYGIWIYSSAIVVEKQLDNAEALNIEAVAAGDMDALRSASSLIEESDSATANLSKKLGPTRVAAASLGWLPWFGDQLRAPNLLKNRAEADLIGANRLISAATVLSGARALIGDGGLSLGPATDKLDEILDSLELHSAQAAVEMTDIRNAASEMDGVSLLWFLESRANRVTNLERRLLDGGQVLLTAPEALESALRVGDSAKTLLDAFGATRSKLDLVTLISGLDQLAISSGEASAAIAEFDASVSRFMPGSQLAELSTDLSAGINAVAQMSAGLNTISQSVNVAFSTLAENPEPLLENGDSLLQALGQLASERDSLAAAVEQADSGLRTLSRLIADGRVDYLPEGFEDAVLGQSEALVAAGRMLVDGPALLLDLIAPESTKTYLVLGQSSDELRAAGGFTSSAWTLTFQDGALKSNQYIPILDFDRLTESSESVQPAPEPLQYYMDAGALYLRDVGWSPDFASVGRTASSLYSSNQQGDVDGVIAINQWGIIRLVEAIGGVNVVGIPVSPDETLKLIEDRTDAEGTQFLQLMFTGLLDSLRGDTEVGSLLDVMLALNEMLRRKELMLYSNSPGEQTQIEALEWGGRMPVDQRDRLAIVDSNVGWSKSDRSIVRSARYLVDLSGADRPAADLTLRYVHSGAETGRSCETHSPPLPWHAVYEASKNSCYWNYVRAFVAVGAAPVSTPALPLPVNSVPDQRGRQKPGTTTFSTEFDENGDYFAGLVTTPPGEVSEFSIGYALPASVVRRDEAGMTYELVLVAQPGALGRTILVDVKLPVGQILASSSHDPIDVSDQTVRFEFDLVTDQVLRIETATDSPG